MKLRPLAAERKPSGNVGRDGEFREAAGIRGGGGVSLAEQDGGAAVIGADRPFTIAEGEGDLVEIADAVVTFVATDFRRNSWQRPGEHPQRIGGSDRVMAVLFDGDGDAGGGLVNRLRVKGNDGR